MAAEELRPVDPAGVEFGDAGGGTEGGADGRTLLHHPSDASLVAFAGGTLGELPGYVVATHLAGCPACRRTVRVAEAVGGVLLDGLPPAHLPPDALEQVLARLDAPVARPRPDGARPSSRAQPGPALPPTLAGLTARPFRWVAPGIHWAGILRRQDGLLGLLRVRPGTSLPLHSHRGQEMTLVLEGAYEGPDGRFVPGDCEEADEGVAHDQAAVGEQDCICLVATSGRMRFRTPLSRLWQPFMPF